jgi:hypothetical protein
MATVDDSTVTLECEMRAYIRPDSSLIWEGPGDREIASGTGKHHITFSDGSPDTAANGDGDLVPSRVSILTITNPEPSDAGTYTCRVINTTEAVTMELIVNGSASLSTTTSKSKLKYQAACSNGPYIYGEFRFTSTCYTTLLTLCKFDYSHYRMWIDSTVR